MSLPTLLPMFLLTHVPALQRRVRILVLYTYRRKIDCHVAALLAMTNRGCLIRVIARSVATWQSHIGTTDFVQAESFIVHRFANVISSSLSTRLFIT